MTGVRLPLDIFTVIFDLLAAEYRTLFDGYPHNPRGWPSSAGSDPYRPALGALRTLCNCSLLDRDVGPYAQRHTWSIVSIGWGGRPYHRREDIVPLLHITPAEFRRRAEEVPSLVDAVRHVQFELGPRYFNPKEGREVIDGFPKFTQLETLYIWPGRRTDRYYDPTVEGSWSELDTSMKQGLWELLSLPSLRSFAVADMFSDQGFPVRYLLHANGLQSLRLGLSHIERLRAQTPSFDSGLADVPRPIDVYGAPADLQPIKLERLSVRHTETLRDLLRPIQPRGFPILDRSCLKQLAVCWEAQRCIRETLNFAKDCELEAFELTIASWDLGTTQRYSCLAAILQNSFMSLQILDLYFWENSTSDYPIVPNVLSSLAQPSLPQLRSLALGFRRVDGYAVNAYREPEARLLELVSFIIKPNPQLTAEEKPSNPDLGDEMTVEEKLFRLKLAPTTRLFLRWPSLRQVKFSISFICKLSFDTDLPRLKTASIKHLSELMSSYPSFQFLFDVNGNTVIDTA